MPARPVLADRRHSNRLAAMLARVFDRDPHFNWLVRQDRRRQDALERLFRLLLEDLPGEEGEVHVAADGQAVAIWYPPGGGHLPLRRQLALLKAYLPISGLPGLPAKALGLSRMESRRPAQPHYFLQVIGVAKAAQGQGHGRGLMRRMLRQCDARQLPAYLETSNPDNLAFYGRFGFRVTGRYRLPGGPELWQLLRLPGEDAPSCHFESHPRHG